MKFTQSNLDKLEDILHESGFTTRYERGTFQSGWCLLEQKRIVVLNKFLDTEGKINTLMELIPQLQIDFDKLTHESQKLYEEIKGWELQHVTPIPYISSRTEMNELYERVDAIVTKPGGITVSEALRKNLPIFVHSALPGQEEVNLRYLTERNLVQELKADQSLESQLQAVLQDADKMSTLYNAIAAYHKEIEAQTPEELLAVVNWILGEKQTIGLHA